jgi:hypothetical protein
MAIKKYTVEVVRTDEYEIEIDDSIWTDEIIETWSDSFFPTDEDNRQESIVKHLADSLTRLGLRHNLEGFGFVKQKQINARMSENEIIAQYKYDCCSGNTRISEEDYTKGLSVNIITYDYDYETEIFNNGK